MMDQLTRRVEQHVALLNDAVRGDFAPFLATFADAAVMRFEGVPAGPYVGRAADMEEDLVTRLDVSFVPESDSAWLAAGNS